MKLSDDLQQCHVSGDFGKALEGYAERAKRLEESLEYMIREADGWHDECRGGNIKDIDVIREIVGV